MIKITNKTISKHTLKPFIFYGVLIASCVLPFTDSHANGSRDITSTQQQLDQQAETIKNLQLQVDGLANGKLANNSSIERSPNNKLEFSISGWVNQLIFSADDGDDTTVFYGNNNNADSRLDFIATGHVSETFKLGSIIELGFRNNSSNEVSQDDETKTSLIIRLADVFFDSTVMGRLSLGLGHSASDQTAEVDLSGTNSAGLSAIQRVGGRLRFYNTTTNSFIASPRVGDSLNNLDGLARRGRVRYDSPTFCGFQLSTSATDESDYDIAARYNGEFHYFKLEAAVAGIDRQVIESSQTPEIDVRGHAIDGSGSILLNNGINATIAGALLFARDSEHDDPHYIYGKLGYQATWFSSGKTNFSVDYGRFDDYLENGDRGRVYSFAAVQRFEAWKTEIFFGYRKLKLDRSGTNFDDIDIFLGGAKVSF